jgi:hypothetical protein
MPTFDYNHIADTLRRVRETVHDHTPGPLTASSLVMGAPGLAANAAVRAAPTLARAGYALMGNAGVSPAAQMMPTAAQAPSTQLEPPWQKFKEQADKLAELKPAVPDPAAKLPWWASGDMTKMFPGAAPTPIAPQEAPPSAGPQAPSVPMPQVRPAEAPQAQPDTSFFMRNALSMRDPSTGELIDPSGASSVRGPDLISKMMTYLHNKA